MKLIVVEFRGGRGHECTLVLRSRFSCFRFSDAGCGFLEQQPQIILLKEGTDVSQGKAQLISNINACIAVVDVVRTTLGPRGMDKLVHDDKGTTISNDGATIMKLLDIVHPAAKILVDIAKSQDSEVCIASIAAYCHGLYRIYRFCFFVICGPLSYMGCVIVLCKNVTDIPPLRWFYSLLIEANTFWYEILKRAF